jgi:transcriptional regulator with XRE-family HTH domain
MPRPPSAAAPPYVKEVASILATNVTVAMMRRYRTLPHQTAMLKRLAADSGVGKGTVERILKGSTTSFPGLDKIARLANTLKVPVQALMVQGGVQALFVEHEQHDDHHRGELQRR